MTLYVYPGVSEYACTKCNQETIPRTFKNGFPICLGCADKFGLDPQPFEFKGRATPGKIK